MHAQILAAAERLAGIARHTPLLPAPWLDERCAASVWLKCENLQRGGAFKFRGAYNAMSQLDPAARARGVLSYSSGNHAQALALAGRLLGVPVTVVMPRDAPAVKRAATAGYGARILDYDPEREDRESLARGLPEFATATLIPPFDHPQIIAGQGTTALEILAERPGLDWLLVPCGGGGLLAGCAVAAKRANPRCRVVGVEPEGADDAKRSFESGRLQRLDRPRTLADGLRTPSLGQHNFALIRRHVDAFVSVDEDSIRDAVRRLAECAKLVVEPSGAVAVAALLAGRLAVSGQVAVVLSGGNVDPGLLARILSGS